MLIIGQKWIFEPDLELKISISAGLTKPCYRDELTLVNLSCLIHKVKFSIFCFFLASGSLLWMILFVTIRCKIRPLPLPVQLRGSPLWSWPRGGRGWRWVADQPCTSPRNRGATGRRLLRELMHWFGATAISQLPFWIMLGHRIDKYSTLNTGVVHVRIEFPLQVAVARGLESLRAPVGVHLHAVPAHQV